MDIDPRVFFTEIFGANNYSELGIDFSAEKILIDCFRKGNSIKWIGHCDNFKLLKEKLIKFNIENTDDSFREWRIVVREKTKRPRR